MNGLPPAKGSRAKSASEFAYPPPPHVEAYAAWALIIARMDAMADASLPAMRPRISPGTAMAASRPIIATTKSSSTSEKPSALEDLQPRMCREIGALIALSQKEGTLYEPSPLEKCRFARALL